MDVELLEIRDFLSQHAPFEWLSEETLNTLVKKISIRYLRKNSHFPPEDAQNDSVYIVRQGAINVGDQNQKLIDVLCEGDIYYSNCIAQTDFEVSVSEDTLFYLLSCETIQQLANDFSQVDYFINNSQGNRLRLALKSTDTTAGSQDEALFLMTTEQLIHTSFEPISAECSIQEVAKIMTQTQQNAAIILESDNSIGIITDQDLRSRCIAAGVSPQQPITQIMTRSAKTIQYNESAFSALLMMSTHNIHHLPVVKGSHVLGIISGNDIIDWQSSHSLSLLKSIEQCSTKDSLITVASKLPQLQVNLIKSGYSAFHFSQVFTSISDAMTRKLIELAQAKLGNAPVDFVWLAVGSQGRQEQGISSDQDNALLLSNEFTDEHQDYFTDLTNFVNEGMNQCGLKFCPGKVMANNPEWQKTLSQWQHTFQEWVEQPDKKAIMLACNFFDMRAVYSEYKDSVLETTLHDKLMQLTKNNSLFIAALTAQAVRNEPPIGFFRQFVLQGEGNHADSIDLKHNALILISDIARIYALQLGIKASSTIERLKQATKNYTLSQEGSDNLIDAWELINSMRLDNQVKQIIEHEEVDNFLTPDKLSSLERNHLKDCFSVIRTIQKTLEQRNQSGRFL